MLKDTFMIPAGDAKYYQEENRKFLIFDYSFIVFSTAFFVTETVDFKYHETLFFGD